MIAGDIMTTSQIPLLKSSGDEFRTVSAAGLVQDVLAVGAHGVARNIQLL